MKKAGNFLKRDWYILLAILIGFLFGIFFYSRLPAHVPIHWNNAGRVDGYGSRFTGAFLMPLVSLGVYLLLCVIPLIDPRAKNYEKFRGSYQMIKSLTVMLLLVMQVCTLLAAVGVKISINIISGAATSVLFVLIGNVMGRFRHNYFVGIRTPWTLANEEVWRKTHRFAGPIWVVGGLSILALTVLDSRLLGIGVLIVVALTVIPPVVYSYLIFRRMEKEKH